MPNIVVCDITYDPLPEDDPEDLTKIPLLHLAHLRNLTVHHSAPEASTSGYLAQLTDRLTLPQLENLEVHCDNEVFPHLTALVARSACRLRTFSVHGTQFNDAVFAFFAHVPNLTELTLGSIVLTVAEALWLTRPTPPVSCPLPALRVLNMDFAQLPAAAFVQMIESRVDDTRSAGGARLEALRVTNIVLDRNTHLRLLALRRPGLRVTVVDQYDRCVIDVGSLYLEAKVLVVNWSWMRRMRRRGRRTRERERKTLILLGDRLLQWFEFWCRDLGVCTMNRG
jgi:hypothetical protein